MIDSPGAVYIWKREIYTPHLLVCKTVFGYINGSAVSSYYPSGLQKQGGKLGLASGMVSDLEFWPV